MANNITIEIEGLDALRARLSDAQITRAVNRGLGRATVKIARILRKAVRMATPVDTGRLKRGTKVRRRRSSPGNYTLEVYSRDSAARGGAYVFYFYILNADPLTAYVPDAIRGIRDQARRILREEITQTLSEALS